MSREINPKAMLEQTKNLIHDFFELQKQIEKFAWMVSIQDEDLFSTLIKLAKVREGMDNYHSQLPADQAKKTYEERDSIHIQQWSDLCNEERHLTRKLVEFGNEFRKAVNSP